MFYEIYMFKACPHMFKSKNCRKNCSANLINKNFDKKFAAKYH